MTGWFTRLFRPHLAMTESERETGTLVLGQPGVGKSSLLEWMAWEDIQANRGIAFVDQAGDTVQSLIRRIVTKPNLWARTIIIDPTNAAHLVRLNPLSAFQNLPPELIGQFVSDILTRIWKFDPTKTPRMSWVMNNALVALSALSLTLDDLQDFLLVREFREAQLTRLPEHLSPVRQFFTTEYPRTRGGARMWAGPLLNKVGPLLLNPTMRVMLSGTPGLDFRKIVDEGLIVLVYVPKGLLGEESANLLAAIIVAQFQKAAMSRADSTVRPRYYLYLDEFQNYSTDNITTILDESRKYQLSVVMAHQYLDQLSPMLRSSVLNTTGRIVCMRVGYQDALELAPYIFPREDYFAQPDTRLSLDSHGRTTTLSIDPRRTPVGWRRLAQTLANQDTRRMWIRRKGATEPINARTHDLLPISTDPKRLLIYSGQLFGVDRQTALAQLQKREVRRRAFAGKQKGRTRR